jgi:hypothetical protein
MTTTELTITFRPCQDLGDQVYFRAESGGMIWIATGLTTGRYLTASEQAGLFTLLQVEAKAVDYKYLADRFYLSGYGVRTLANLEALRVVGNDKYSLESAEAYGKARQAVLALLSLKTSVDLRADVVDNAMNDIYACSKPIHALAVQFTSKISANLLDNDSVSAFGNLSKALVVLVDLLRMLPSLTESQQDTFLSNKAWSVCHE